MAKLSKEEFKELAEKYIGTRVEVKTLYINSENWPAGPAKTHLKKDNTLYYCLRGHLVWGTVIEDVTAFKEADSTVIKFTNSLNKRETIEEVLFTSIYTGNGDYFASFLQCWVATPID